MYKYGLVLIIPIILINFFIKNDKNEFTTPLSAYYQIESKLTKNLSSKNIQSYNLSIDTYNQKISFQIKENDYISTVIFSPQKDIYMQTNALQKILKTVRINQSYLKTIDFSLKKPYATIQNN